MSPSGHDGRLAEARRRIRVTDVVKPKCHTIRPRVLLRHWTRSRMTMLDALHRRPEFCHPEFSSGLRRGFPTVAERLKIHLTTMRNLADQPCRLWRQGSASCPFTPAVQTVHVMVSRRRRWVPLMPIRDNGDLQDGQMC